MSRTSANLTKSEIAVYQSFCLANRIALDGADGEKNGSLFAEIIGIKMDSDFTQDSLETAFAQLHGKLKLVSATYKAADDLARLMTAEEQNVYRIWSKNQKYLVGIDGSPEGVMNVKSLLEWTKGRGSVVTSHLLDLALSNLINSPLPGQRIHFHARPAQQDRSVVQGRKNYAFNQEEQPKAAAPTREFVNGRRNHSYVAPEDAAKKVATEGPRDAWKDICQIQLKEWSHPSQQVRLQGEYDAGIKAGKSWSDISMALASIIRNQQRGR